ncbi:SUMF1/EgtB/PvdO family nonheme iron enzyme [Tautonia plasticadhaerens]|uniref:Serine/threonine-protein kinase StkP n=1 Tax=Tautonia plasticadhaerens TaxID=2527974 RepID=A0A518H7E4_9BACT|nr:SUMF1/EgtB/PvdO family nonheme iron enzyme [Tautonia plasticadhaerens]QDV36711.1 Serine/threonine-protein kinase StkP [Tautonia plasticadhaerens]
MSGSPSSCTPSVPGYEILRPLSRGGMGLVVLARQVRLGRPVAITFLSAEADTDPGPGITRFRREAEPMARISHPNVPAIHDSGEVEGRPDLVTGYVEGWDLRRLMRPVGTGRPIPWGLHDLHGDARGPCSGWYDASPGDEGGAGSKIDPSGPKGGDRWVDRGGSWDTMESVSPCRSTAGSHKVFPYFTLGFRVCHDGPGDAERSGTPAPSAADGP